MNWLRDLGHVPEPFCAFITSPVKWRPYQHLLHEVVARLKQVHICKRSEHCSARSKWYRVSTLITVVVIYSVGLGFHVFVGCQGLFSQAFVSSCGMNPCLVIRCLTDETGKARNTFLHVYWFPQTLRDHCTQLQRADRCVPHLLSIWIKIAVGNRPRWSCLKPGSVFIRFIIADDMAAANTSFSRLWLFSRGCALHSSDFLKDSSSVNCFNSVVFGCALEMLIYTLFFGSLLS